jgi:hypothetical protein
MFTSVCHRPGVREYTVAADKVSRMALPASSRTGSRVGHHLQRVPEKWVHAVATSTAATLCGKPVKGLHRFEALLFEHVNVHLRCRVCDREAGHPRGRRS